VVSRSEHTILIGGSLCDSIISNILRHDVAGTAVTIASGPEFVCDVTLSKIHVVTS
jgi:hypothetical protein